MITLPHKPHWGPRIDWVLIQKYHKLVIGGLLCVAIGAWAQSIGEKLPVLEHKAEVSLPLANRLLHRKDAQLSVAGAKLKSRDQEIRYCKVLIGQFPP